MIKQNKVFIFTCFLIFLKQVRKEDFNQSSLHEENQTMPLTHKNLDCSGSLRLKVCLTSVFSISFLSFIYSFLKLYVFFHFFSLF